MSQKKWEFITHAPIIMHQQKVSELTRLNQKYLLSEKYLLFGSIIWHSPDSWPIIQFLATHRNRTRKSKHKTEKVSFSLLRNKLVVTIIISDKILQQMLFGPIILTKYPHHCPPTLNTSQETISIIQSSTKYLTNIFILLSSIQFPSLASFYRSKGS